MLRGQCELPLSAEEEEELAPAEPRPGEPRLGELRRPEACSLLRRYLLAASASDVSLMVTLAAETLAAEALAAEAPGGEVADSAAPSAAPSPVWAGASGWLRLEAGLYARVALFDADHKPLGKVLEHARRDVAAARAWLELEGRLGAGLPV